MKVVHEEMGIRDPEKIDNGVIRQCLKRLGLRRYYENVNQIRCFLTGAKPVRLTPAQTVQIKQLFEMANNSFIRVCPSERKNFLSYHYVIRKLLELINLEEYCCYFTSLKGREKVWRQDQIWRLICQDNGWVFKASI